MTGSRAQEQAAEMQLLETILERAAEELGDVHPQIIRYFFSQCPEAEEVFTQHGGIHRIAMQNAMIDWGMYCLLCWLDNVGEAKNALTDAAHRHKSSQIDSRFTRTLMESMFTVLGRGVSLEDVAEQRLWHRIESEIIRFLMQAELSH